MKPPLLLMGTYFLLVSCLNGHGNGDLQISKIETEYKADSFQRDSCIIIRKVFYKDGSTLNTYYIQYPTTKLVTYLDRDDKFIYEIQVLDSDSVRNQMFYDAKGNEVKYVRKFLTKNVPDQVDEYHNFYDKVGRLEKQIQYGSDSQIEKRINIVYDTLNYSRVEYEKQHEDSSLSEVRYYQNGHLAKLKYSYLDLPYEYSYDNQGRLIYEDPPHQYRLRRFYTYKNNLVISAIEKYHFKDGSFSNPNERTDYKYQFDNQKRPISITKSTFIKGNLINETITVIIYN